MSATIHQLHAKPRQQLDHRRTGVARIPRADKPQQWVVAGPAPVCPYCKARINPVCRCDDGVAA